MIALLRQQLFVYRNLWTRINQPFQMPPDWQPLSRTLPFVDNTGLSDPFKSRTVVIWGIVLTENRNTLVVNVLQTEHYRSGPLIDARLRRRSI